MLDPICSNLLQVCGNNDNNNKYSLLSTFKTTNFVSQSTQISFKSVVEIIIIITIIIILFHLKA